MLRDRWITRALVWSLIGALDAVPLLSALWLAAASFTRPASPAAAFTTTLPPGTAAEILLKFRLPLHLLTAWAAAEVAWWAISRVMAVLLDRRWWDQRATQDAVTSEERWRLWRSMVESMRDPWDWMGGVFLPASTKRAPRGAEDPVFQKVKADQVGRANVEEYIAHLMFNRQLRDVKADPLARAELHSMILLLEAQFTLSRPGLPPFRFLRGRSRHSVFELAKEPLSMGHHPLIFYAAIAFTAQLGNLALFCAGFRFYGSAASWPFPPFFMRSSRRSLESLLDPLEAERMGDARLASRVGYWMKPASKQAQEEDLRPIVFAHGISGTFVTVPFLIALCAVSGRAVFLPEIPYVSMRLAPPSAILTRLEYVAAVRRMLWAHGFGLTSLDADENDSDYDDELDDEEWRRAKAVVVAHSFGSGAAAWLLRDAPDIVAGTVLIDPMSFLLFSSDTPRNFFRTKCRTAGERFFRYFSLERGINHFLSRHLRWSDSVTFVPTPPAPLPPRVVEALVPTCAREPLEPPFDVPNYAPFISPCPAGPLPTVVFLSENDCILPVRKVRAYLEAAGFSTGAAAPTAAATTGTGADKASVAKALEASAPVSGTDERETTVAAATTASAAAPFASLHVLPALEHGAILAPAPALLRRVRAVARAVDAVERAAKVWDEAD
ncbi:hypothetical protein JCM3770_002134 [Rhodotorula araucariae]